MISPNYFLIFLVIAHFTCVECKRKVTAKLNPGCEQNLNPSMCKDLVLVHVMAEGQNDTLHHLWDFTGKPSLLLVVTDKNATISIAWQQYSYGEEGAVTINPMPKYFYGVVLDKVIEFNDEDDTGFLNVTNDNSSYVSLLDTKNFNWKLIDLKNDTGDTTVIIEATEFNDSKIVKNGTVQIVVKAFGGEDHGEALPHLLHSGNTSQVDLTLDGLSTQYKSSRFGLGLITVSSDQPNATLPSIEQRKTLDDEHAPGVFTMVELLMPEVTSGGSGGYIQWRPIAYTSPSRDMTTSTETGQYSVVAPAAPRTALNHTLVFSVLGSRLDNMLTLATNITFGQAGDGFYRKNKYIAWTILVGYGQPPEEHFSMLVTLVLLIGLGLPAILILTGTICIVVRRLQRNKNDLCLNR